MVTVSFSLPAELFMTLESQRGRIPRSRFYRDLINSGRKEGEPN